MVRDRYPTDPEMLAHRQPRRHLRSHYSQLDVLNVAPQHRWFTTIEHLGIRDQFDGPCSIDATSQQDESYVAALLEQHWLGPIADMIIEDASLVVAQHDAYLLAIEDQRWAPAE